MNPIPSSFVIQKKKPLPEIRAELTELVHTPTGARFLHIAADDPENLFCLSFPTRPTSSNGVAHILEHTVLCGSKKFPIKDPFFSMTRRSLNTYMNALTGQDFTCYPASSQIEKDFYNLLEIYLDATFFPELKKESFLQEGHRLAFNDRNELEWQGIVYNEMKGALSSFESRLFEKIMQNLTQDLTYAHNSGGDPKEIPSLTHEELKAFHREFYHPSRALFFFYGNLPLDKHLAFVETHVLSQFSDSLPPLPPIPQQKRMKTPVIGSSSYPIAKGEKKKNGAIIALSFLTVSIREQEELLALLLLDSLLMDTDASFLKKALLKSNLCSSAESSLDEEMSEAPFTIVCKGCQESGALPLRDLIFEILQTVSFSCEEIEASLHQLEIERTEIGGEGVPFGLSLFFRTALAQQHGAVPEEMLQIHTHFDALRQKAQDPSFFASLIQKHFLDNPHYVLWTLLPDPHLEEREKQEEKERLEKCLLTIDPKRVRKEMEAFSLFQEKVENQSIDCLPKLLIEEIPEMPRDYPLKEEKKGPFLQSSHACFANQLLYANLIYDLPPLPMEDLPLLALLVRFLPEVGFKHMNYEQALKEQHAYTGGIDASIALNVQAKDPHTMRPALVLRGKALQRNQEKLFSLLKRGILEADFTDRARIEQLLKEHTTNLQNRLVKQSLNYAIQTSLSAFSPSSLIYNQLHGLPYLQNILKMGEDPHRLIEELLRVQQMAIGKGEAHLVISADPEVIDSLSTSPLEGLPTAHPLPVWRPEKTLPHVPSQVRFIGAPVAFSVLGMNTISSCHSASPLLLLVTELLDNCFLHKEIREKGGAYGSGASYSPMTGNFHLYAYRDPHLHQTIDTFHTSIQKLGQGEFSDIDLEEAKFGAIQSLDAPVAPGNRALVSFGSKRTGRDLEQRACFRKALLKANRNEVIEAIRTHLWGQKETFVSFLGETLYEQEKKELKEPLEILEI